MRETRIARAFVAVLCIALVLLVATVGGPSAAHIDLAVPVLILCFLVVFRLSLLDVADDSSAVQPTSFLAVHNHRPPPLA